jgi:hypothetical protein
MVRRPNESQLRIKGEGSLIDWADLERNCRWMPRPNGVSGDQGLDEGSTMAASAPIRPNIDLIDVANFRRQATSILPRTGFALNSFSVFLIWSIATGRGPGSSRLSARHMPTIRSSSLGCEIRQVMCHVTRLKRRAAAGKLTAVPTGTCRQWRARRTKRHPHKAFGQFRCAPIERP